MRCLLRKVQGSPPSMGRKVSGCKMASPGRLKRGNSPANPFLKALQQKCGETHSQSVTRTPNHFDSGSERAQRMAQQTRGDVRAGRMGTTGLRPWPQGDKTYPVTPRRCTRDPSKHKAHWVLRRKEKKTRAPQIRSVLRPPRALSPETAGFQAGGSGLCAQGFGARPGPPPPPKCPRLPALTRPPPQVGRAEPGDHSHARAEN